MSAIKWTGRRDDKTAYVGRYRLRAEMMDRGCWWWGVYRDERVCAWPYEKEWGRTLDAAKRKAVAAMRKHAKETP